MRYDDCKVLVVDDAEAILYAKTRILRNAGFSVIQASTGAQALNLIASARPDLVLLDVNLPDIDGIEVCLRAKRDFPGLLVAQTSATFTGTKHRIHGLESGADVYLTEPMDPLELVANVTALLRLKKTEAALRESRQRFQFVLEASDVYAWEWDPQTGAVSRSANAARVLGVDPDAVASGEEAFAAIIHPDDRDKARADLAAGIAQGERLEREFRITDKTGGVRWIRERAEVMRDPAGRALRISGIGVNVTADRLLLQQKDLLVREVHHRIKNSLQLVSSLLSIQARRAAPDLRVHLRHAQQRLLAVAKVHQNLFETGAPHSLDLGRFLRALATDITNSLTHSERWELEFDIDPVELDVKYGTPLAVMAGELIINALKHGESEPRSHLKVALRRHGTDGIELSVADAGPGLPPGFEPDRSKGLGMRLVHLMCQNLGAQLTVGTPAVGAQFIVRAPHILKAAPAC